MNILTEIPADFSAADTELDRPPDLCEDGSGNNRTIESFEGDTEAFIWEYAAYLHDLRFVGLPIGLRPGEVKSLMLAATRDLLDAGADGDGEIICEDRLASPAGPSIEVPDYDFEGVYYGAANSEYCTVLAERHRDAGEPLVLDAYLLLPDESFLNGAVDFLHAVEGQDTETVLNRFKGIFYNDEEEAGVIALPMYKIELSEGPQLTN